MSSNAPQGTLKAGSNLPVPPVYEFGPYRLEVPARRLLRKGEPVALTPKALDILLALIERRDRVVDKAELMSLVWPDSFVEEANLSQTIFVLRKTLGEDAGGRQFIDTVPRRGYRFASEVRQPDELAPGGETTRAPRTRRWIAATGAAVALVAGVVFWMSARPADSRRDPLAGNTRVAVLPFENVTGNTADDWLAAAFSASLTSGLQRVEGLILVSRDRIVELYRQRRLREASAADAAAVRQLAEVLAVRYVVHGSYQRIGDRIRVTAQLVDVTDGTIRAQETATDAFGNLLALEDDLARRFADRLERGNPEGVVAGTTSLDAYQATIEGQTLYAENRYQDALEPLTRATTADPRYAPAWALLSKTNARLSTVSFVSSGSVDQLKRDALTFANRAVELGPALYDAHVALALASRESGDVPRWRAAALKAISLNEGIAEAHALLADSYFAGNAFGCQRDRDPGRAELSYRTAIRLDPRSAAPYANLSYHFSWLGQEREALATAETGLAVLPDNATVARARALALVRLRRLDDAERDVRRLIEAGASVSGQDHLTLGSIALGRGHLDLAAQEFQTALSRLATSAFPLAIGRAYLDAGRLDDGLAHLDRAVAIEPTCRGFIVTSPAFAPYRKAPPFAARLAAWSSPGR